MNLALRPARRLAVLALVAFAGLAAPATGQTGAGPPDLRLTAASHDTTVAAKLFTYCNSVSEPDGTGTGLCADGIPGPTSQRVPVHRRGSVTVVTNARVSSVSARYADVDAAPSATLRVSARCERAAPPCRCRPRGRARSCSSRWPTRTCPGPMASCSRATPTSASACASTATPLRARRRRLR